MNNWLAFNGRGINCIMTIVSLIIIIISALLAIAFYTLRERKLSGCVQHRKGPNKPTIIGLTIPLADANKLFLKQEKGAIWANIKYQMYVLL